VREFFDSVDFLNKQQYVSSLISEAAGWVDEGRVLSPYRERLQDRRQDIPSCQQLQGYSAFRKEK
jgi:hypothetical protein